MATSDEKMTFLNEKCPELDLFLDTIFKDKANADDFKKSC